MEKILKCEICDGSEWKIIENYEYSKDEIFSIKKNLKYNFFYYFRLISRILILSRPRNYIVKGYSRNKYQLSRFEVLFNVWNKNLNKIKLTSVYCKKCGFCTYSPRPTKLDIEAKYNFLIKNSFDYNLKKKYSYKDLTKLDIERAKSIYIKCKKYKNNLNFKNLNVLDFGGGIGSNLINFINQNNTCSLIDFNKDNLPGIKNIGDDIDDLEADQKFDVIICSHVLEHVSNLNFIVSKLKSHLNNDGIIYVEVPLEIKAGLSIETDPITHINFFNKNSLVNLFLINRYKLLGYKEEILPHTSTYINAMWLIAQNDINNNSFCMLRNDISKDLYPNKFLILYKIIYLYLKNIKLKLNK